MKQMEFVSARPMGLMESTEHDREAGCRFMTVMILGILSVLIACGHLRAMVSQDNPDVRVLMLIPHHWGANTILNLNNFKSKGWNLTAAGLTQDVEPCAWFKNSTGVSSFHTDVLISDIDDVSRFDVLAIMSASSRYGQNPYGDLLGSPETLTLVQSAVQNGLVVWATCAGVRVLAAADVIEGRNVVGSARFAAEYAAAGATFLGDDHAPVIDGPIVTAVRGNYYNYHIAEAIAVALEQQPARYRPLRKETIELNQRDLQWSNIDWGKAFGTDASICARGVCVGTDGGYAVVGTISASGGSDMVLILVDASGNLMRAIRFGGERADDAHAICPAPDGGYLLAGVSNSFSSDGNRDFYVVRTTAQGDLVWQKTLGGPALDSANSICRIENGGYVVCGLTESKGAGEDDAWIIRIDESGEMLWEAIFGGTRTDSATCVTESRDGNVLVSIACGSPEYSSKNMDYAILALDSSGRSLWWQTYNNESGEGYDYPMSLIETADRGIVITGSSDTTVPVDCTIIKTGPDGIPEWTRTEEGSFHEFGIHTIELNDGTISLANIDQPDQWNTDAWLIRHERTGSVRWDRIAGGVEHDWATAMCRSTDSSIIVVGHTQSVSLDCHEAFIAKIPTDFLSVPSVELVMPSDSFGPGDRFWMSVRVWNPGLATTHSTPLFVFLDVYGEYFFWPGWTRAADCRIIDVRPGADQYSVIDQFDWPSDVGSAEGIGVYAAMTDSAMTTLWGDYDRVTFGWHP